MSLIRTATTVLLMAWLAGPAFGAPRMWQVRDTFVFSPAARQEANDRIQELNDRYNINFVVESVKAPTAPRTLFGKAKPAGTAKAEDRAPAEIKKRAANLGGRDVRVLVLQEPPSSADPYMVAVLVGKEIEHAVPTEARERLRAGLAAALRTGDQSHADDGLRAAVDRIATTLRASLGTAPFGVPEALSILLPFLAAWLFLECLGRLIALRVPAEGPTLDPVDHNGGGSFLPVMFAAMAAGDLRELWRRSPPADSRRTTLADTVLLPDARDLDATAAGDVAPPESPVPPASNAADPTLCDTRSYPGPTP
jgi:hypothetical protein